MGERGGSTGADREGATMRGYRFYEEYGSEREQSCGNVIALRLSESAFIQPGAICLQAICADGTTTAPNSPVQPRYVNVEYLGKHCRRITEARARELHPRLFEFLDGLA
jgi:hypothetical protein